LRQILVICRRITFQGDPRRGRLSLRVKSLRARDFEVEACGGKRRARRKARWRRNTRQQPSQPVTSAADEGSEKVASRSVDLRNGIAQAPTAFAHRSHKRHAAQDSASTWTRFPALQSRLDTGQLRTPVEYGMGNRSVYHSAFRRGGGSGQADAAFGRATFRILLSGSARTLSPRAAEAEVGRQKSGVGGRRKTMESNARQFSAQRGRISLAALVD